ncbi:MAG: hypothetical protein ICV63_13365 [Coleofasciculus sp. Co-bin14]|nr:hypothetical protein [Coleofasciculus sp. Co-bin14]
MIMSAYIILENVPKYQARIDFLSCRIPDRFVGFREVPYGLHYVNVKTKNNNYPGFWCYVKSDQVVVKILRERTQEFEDSDPVGTAQYQELVSIGLLKIKMIPYDYKKSGSWLLLTCHIKPKYFPVTLHTSQQRLSPSLPSQLDWEKEVFETHKGSFYSFMSEFQFAFIRWYVSDLDRPGPDAEAFNRWRYLVEATCNADMSSLAKAPELVNVLASALTSQFNSLDDSLLPSNDPLVEAARRLQEKMLNGEIPLLGRDGQELKNYLEQRYQSA